MPPQGGKKKGAQEGRRPRTTKLILRRLPCAATEEHAKQFLTDSGLQEGQQYTFLLHSPGKTRSVILVFAARSVITLFPGKPAR
jgi:hypothetical protein